MQPNIVPLFIIFLSPAVAIAQESHHPKLSLTSLPWDAPVAGILISILFAFFPFLLMIGIFLVNKFRKKKTS